MTIVNSSGEHPAWLKMSPNEIIESGLAGITPHSMDESIFQSQHSHIEVVRQRCFLGLVRRVEGIEGFQAGVSTSLVADFLAPITDTIHLPGLRGMPERAYPVAAVGRSFPGTFEKYTASVILNWAIEKQADVLAELNTEMKQLALTGE